MKIQQDTCFVCDRRGGKFPNKEIYARHEEACMDSEQLLFAIGGVLVSALSMSPNKAV